jgi:hypothetical protein
MWPGITPAMKKIELRMQSIPGPATSMTETGGPGFVSGSCVKAEDGKATEDVDEEDHQAF